MQWPQDLLTNPHRQELTQLSGRMSCVFLYSQSNPWIKEKWQWELCTGWRCKLSQQSTRFRSPPGETNNTSTDIATYRLNRPKGQFSEREKYHWISTVTVLMAMSRSVFALVFLFAMAMIWRIGNDHCAPFWGLKTSCRIPYLPQTQNVFTDYKTPIKWLPGGLKYLFGAYY